MKKQRTIVQAKLKVPNKPDLAFQYATTADYSAMIP